MKLIIHIYREYVFASYLYKLSNDVMSSLFCRFVSSSDLRPLHSHCFPLTPAWISDYIYHKIWVDISYPFPNFNYANVVLGLGMYKWFHPSLLQAMWLLIQTLSIHVSKKGPRWQLPIIRQDQSITWIKVDVITSQLRFSLLYMNILHTKNSRNIIYTNGKGCHIAYSTTFLSITPTWCVFWPLRANAC